MTRTFQRMREGRLILIGVLFHLAFLVGSPFEHHDLLCHLKTPLHCTACASSSLGSDPQVPNIASGGHLEDAGALATFVFIENGAILAVSSSGRSPPSLV